MAYWEVKSQTYPTLGDAGAAARGAALRAKAGALGVRFDVPAILDAGAGTGIHAAALATDITRVVAVDMSPSMLAALTALNPPNVEVLAADLVDLDLSARGWAGSFDLVWACMTPISGDPRGLAQLERASRGQVCCITWGPNRQDPLFEEAFALHGSTFRPPAWREAIAAHARSRGHRLVHELIPNRMEQHIAPEALVIDLAHHLRWLGIEPDERRLGDWAAARARDGLVHRSLDADQEIWLWTL